MRFASNTLSKLLCLLLLFFAGGCLDSQLVRAQSTERKLLKKVDVSYPDILKRSSIGGTVKLKLTVKPDGSVKSVEILGGNPILAEAAKNSALQWKYASAAAESQVDVAIVFDPSANK